MTRFNVLLLSALLALSACATNWPLQNLKPTVSVREAHQMAKKRNVLLIDVREADEVQEQAYNMRHAVNIPLSEIESRLAEVPKDKILVMACRSGRRSQQAYDILQANGFKNITNMEGGMLDWEANGLPVTKNTNKN